MNVCVCVCNKSKRNSSVTFRILRFFVRQLASASLAYHSLKHCSSYRIGANIQKNIQTKPRTTYIFTQTDYCDIDNIIRDIYSRSNLSFRFVFKRNIGLPVTIRTRRTIRAIWPASRNIHIILYCNPGKYICYPLDSPDSFPHLVWRALSVSIVFRGSH